MRLSVVIPARNEAACIESTLRALVRELEAHAIDHEIVVVDDGSTDLTVPIVQSLSKELRTLRVVLNSSPHGFGMAVRCGLDASTGDVIGIYMADASDRPEDLVRFVQTMQARNVDCVFGTRFHRKARVIDYPIHKLLLNRMANWFIQVIFAIRYNDVTNACKLYRRHVIEGARPLLSHHFNLTLELPLKAIVRGYSYAVIPNDWINRKSGVSKLRIQEMGSRYLFIVLYCFLERWLSRGDYARPVVQSPTVQAPTVTRANLRPDER